VAHTAELEGVRRGICGGEIAARDLELLSAEGSPCSPCAGAGPTFTAAWTAGQGEQKPLFSAAAFPSMAGLEPGPESPHSAVRAQRA
jgi:hypothetical protein